MAAPEGFPEYIKIEYELFAEMLDPDTGLIPTQNAKLLSALVYYFFTGVEPPDLPTNAQRVFNAKRSMVAAWRRNVVNGARGGRAKAANARRELEPKDSGPSPSNEGGDPARGERNTGEEEDFPKENFLKSRGFSETSSQKNGVAQPPLAAGTCKGASYPPSYIINQESSINEPSMKRENDPPAKQGGSSEGKFRPTREEAIAYVSKSPEFQTYFGGWPHTNPALFVDDFLDLMEKIGWKDEDGTPLDSHKNAWVPGFWKMLKCQFPEPDE